MMKIRSIVNRMKKLYESLFGIPCAGRLEIEPSSIRLTRYFTVVGGCSYTGCASRLYAVIEGYGMFTGEELSGKRVKWTVKDCVSSWTDGPEAPERELVEDYFSWFKNYLAERNFRIHIKGRYFSNKDLVSIRSIIDE